MPICIPELQIRFAEYATIKKHTKNRGFGHSTSPGSLGAVFSKLENKFFFLPSILFDGMRMRQSKGPQSGQAAPTVRRYLCIEDRPKIQR